MRRKPETSQSDSVEVSATSWLYQSLAHISIKSCKCGHEDSSKEIKLLTVKEIVMMDRIWKLRLRRLVHKWGKLLLAEWREASVKKILIVAYVFLLFVHVFLMLSMYSYRLRILIVVYLFLSLSMYSYRFLCILIVRPCILIVRPCILIVVYVFLLLSMYSYCSSMYSYCCLCILIVVYVFLSLSMYSYCSSMYSYRCLYTYCCLCILIRGYPDWGFSVLFPQL
jgi:hypothetical protein